MTSSSGTGTPSTKSDLVREYVVTQRWEDAIKLAATFRLLSKEHKRILQEGKEAVMRPGFQRQLGKDPDVQRQLAIDVLFVLYGPRQVYNLSEALNKEDSK